MLKKIISLKIIFILLVFAQLFAIKIIAQQTAQVSIPFQVYDDAGGGKTLFFGLDQTASDDIDDDLGESDLPPLPPTGVFDARMILPINNFNGTLSSWYDYRNAASFPYTGTKEHRLKYQSAEGATVFYFSWDFPPAITALLQDIITGTLVNVQLSGTGVYELTNFIQLNQLKLIINYNSVITTLTESKNEPQSFNLKQNYPNPFNPSTTIQFMVPEISFVSLSVYNLLGEKVTTIINETLDAGVHKIEFSGNGLPSGVYIAKFQAGNYIQSIKLILAK